MFTEITGLAHFSWVVSAISRATWFRISKNAGDRKASAVSQKLEMIESGAATGGDVKQKSSHYETKELQLELHTDLAHALRDDDNKI